MRLQKHFTHLYLRPTYLNTSRMIRNDMPICAMQKMLLALLLHFAEYYIGFLHRATLPVLTTM